MLRGSKAYEEAMTRVMEAGFDNYGDEDYTSDEGVSDGTAGSDGNDNDDDQTVPDDDESLDDDGDDASVNSDDAFGDGDGEESSDREDDSVDDEPEPQVPQRRKKVRTDWWVPKQAGSRLLRTVLCRATHLFGRAVHSTYTIGEVDTNHCHRMNKSGGSHLQAKIAVKRGGRLFVGLI